MYPSILGHGSNAIRTTLQSSTNQRSQSGSRSKIDVTPLLTASPRRIEWGSKIYKSPPTVTYQEAMAEDDIGLFKWLSNVVGIYSFMSLKDIRFDGIRPG